MQAWLDPRPHTRTELTLRLHTGMTFELPTKNAPGVLDSSRYGLFVQVQDQWAVANEVYDRLRDRYRAHLSNRRVGSGPRDHRGSDTLPMFDPDWRPTRGELTTEEVDMLKMEPVCLDYDSVEVNDKVRFCTDKSQKVVYPRHTTHAHTHTFTCMRLYAVPTHI